MNKIIIANWKMNKTSSEVLDFFKDFSFSGNSEVVICPSFPLLGVCSKNLPKNVLLGAQNCHFLEKGAFTGEVSISMLKDFSVSHILVGHSERRIYFNEDNELINKKLLAVLNSGLIPVLCVGENAKERESGLTEKILEHQLKKGLDSVSNSMEKIIVAYEPVWAISSFQTSSVKRTASLKDISEAHSMIRKILQRIFGEKSSDIRICYGGSVSQENCKEIFALPGVQGALVGAASLGAENFSRIVDSV